MEIGPIPGIRAVQPVQSNRTPNDLSGVFRVEFQREQQQERYTPHRQGAERGLEDDDDETAAQDETTDAAPIHAANEGPGRQISFFA